MLLTIKIIAGVYFNKMKKEVIGKMDRFNQSTFRIGVSGHQQIGDETTFKFVSQHLRELLTLYKEQAFQRGHQIVAYSSLAVGADQLFAQTALDLDIPLEAVIPCAHYEELYTSAEALDAYRHLLNLCQHVHSFSEKPCSEEVFLHAGYWIVDHSDMLIFIWNGRPPMGKGGTGDIATYARLKNLPYVHLHTLRHTIKHYGQSTNSSTVTIHTSPKRDFTTAKRTIYQGPVLAVNQYRLRMPTGEEIVRDIVERPESVLILPVGQQQTVLLIEEYDLGAGAWQFKLPGGKVHDATPDGLRMQAEMELREELGYRAGKVGKLLDFYSHPGYVAHKVHLFVAEELEWDPLEMEDQEEVHVWTLKLEEALAATQRDYRCDPEAALALWLYAGCVPHG